MKMPRLYPLEVGVETAARLAFCSWSMMSKDMGLVLFYQAGDQKLRQLRSKPQLTLSFI